MNTQTWIKVASSAVCSAIGLVLVPGAFVGCGTTPSNAGNGTHPDPDSSIMPGDAADGATGGDNDNGSADSSDSPVLAPGLDASQKDDAGDGAPRATDGASGQLDPSVLAVMRSVADWQLLQPGINAIDGTYGAMWTGIFATYQVTQDVKYRKAVEAWGQSSNWGLTGGVTTNADDQCAAQTYFDVYLLGSTNTALVTGAKPSFDAMVTSGDAGWTWADALFMSPPGLTRLGAITDDPRYFQLLHTNWWNAHATMFSIANGLIYRDPPAGGPDAGNDIFWARGNGWVIAGTARVLEYLPKTDARRPEYVSMLTTMAAALIQWQGTDGLWRSDLTHPMTIPNPETSGTGFFTFAMAWGINNAILDRATYLPVVRAGWQGLVNNVDANGKLGYVQGVGAGPAAATATSNAPYGVGAFLLAASEVAKL